jgi:hypothetical protein
MGPKAAIDESKEMTHIGRSTIVFLLHLSNYVYGIKILMLFIQLLAIKSRKCKL